MNGCPSNFFIFFSLPRRSTWFHSDLFGSDLLCALTGLSHTPEDYGGGELLNTRRCGELLGVLHWFLSSPLLLLLRSDGGSVAVPPEAGDRLAFLRLWRTHKATDLEHLLWCPAMICRGMP